MQSSKYEYVVTPSGSKIIPVEEPCSKDEESPADYNSGGYLQVRVGDEFKNGRYRVVRKLGWGHFSTVWLVKDREENRHSALKVVKSAGRYAETARDEIKLLTRVAQFSPDHPGRSHIVSFLDSFTHQSPEASHICIVFEPLGENLLALIERNKKKGVPRALVKIIARQVLLALQYLHDECDLVHTDVKPENILISIPDVEEHIHNELCHSPVPSSRRVGVPVPTKSRAGVNIPQSQRPRRQVQIFHSQPLSSPRSQKSGFTWGSRNGSSASLSGSFKSQKHMTSLTSSTPASPFIGGSSIPKVPSGLSMLVNTSESKLPSKPLAQASHPKPLVGASPASSSPSPISSLSPSVATTSSTVSTPATSFPHSVGIVASPVVGGKDSSAISIIEEEVAEKERVGIPMKKNIVSTGVDSSAGFSWKNSPPWNPKTALKTLSNTAHSRSMSGSGMPTSSSWKDPGLAAPAPAVVAVVVAGADDEYDYFTSSVPSSHHLDSPVYDRQLGDSNVNRKSSSTSSDTTTKSSNGTAHPSPADTPRESEKKGPSLLSQTAPPRNTLPQPELSLKMPPTPLKMDMLPTAVGTPGTPGPPPTKHTRASPEQRISQLSAHMHSHPPPDYASPIDSASSSFILPSSLEPLVGMTSIAVPHPPPSPSPSAPSTPGATPRSSQSDTGLPELLDNEELNGEPPISIKIADLGNATPSKKHYTEDIQTRQYRAPEAILGRKDWDATADIWSVACVVFELLTAEYLFDPQSQGDLFTKDDDHMAQIIELLGDFEVEAKMGGKYSRELFDHNGALRYIKSLKPWPLKSVMMQKYLYTEQHAKALCEFLEPMLVVDFKHRRNARDMVDHPWLEVTPEDDVVGDW